ncbi:hypothetical protein NLI96_g636 [Meripilus lineatus]|uniref:Uncharacterized protein n=1 Tax=Meripilus lineatus TaxID=2056292 RepID=A0AAD5YNQ6_9APHY|nr:hypothetical protein NLI96_g636 [Physisporinus lineatus]
MSPYASSPSTSDKQSLHYIIRSGIAGGFAGCIAKTVVAPLDRVKILFQASNPEYRQYAGSWSGAFRAGAQIYRDGGFVGLFQGHSATLLRIFPYAAIKFMVYDQIENVLMPTREQQTNARRFTAGALSGITSVFFTYPLDLIRVRMAFYTRSSIAHSSGPSRPTFAYAVSRIYHETPAHHSTTLTSIASSSHSSGAGAATLTLAPSRTLFSVLPILKFYRGFTVTVAGMVPYAGTSFLTWGFLRSHLLPPSSQGKPTSLTKTTLADLGIGALSGALSMTVSYPFEIIRRRMQVGGLHYPDRWMRWDETVLGIWRASGWRGFFPSFFQHLHGPSDPRIAIKFSHSPIPSSQSSPSSILLQVLDYPARRGPANEVTSYSNVLLLTHHQVKCFHRTLQSRRSRKLAGLVKELSVLLASDDRLRGPTYRTYSPQGYRSFVERNKDLKNELRFILRSLPVLEYSSVRFLDPFSIAMGYGHFFGPCGIASHSLKNLIIHGISIFASFYEMSFPCLEVLCFHLAIHLRPPTFKFPRLSLRLSVLQLLRTSQRTGRVIHDLLTESKFPSLHTLQLYENRHLESSNNLSCPPHILDIRCLHLIGKAEISYFETLRRAGALDNLQHLAIGQIIRPFDPLRLWQFPTSIETLTFLVDTALTKNSSEESLFDSLQSELARHKEGFSRVRRIRVYVHGENVGDVARERMALDMYSAIYRTINMDKWIEYNLYFPPEVTPPPTLG